LNPITDRGRILPVPEAVAQSISLCSSIRGAGESEESNSQLARQHWYALCVEAFGSIQEKAHLPSGKAANSKKLLPVTAR
jgi:hypothetical protein